MAQQAGSGCMCRRKRVMRSDRHRVLLPALFYPSSEADLPLRPYDIIFNNQRHCLIIHAPATDCWVPTRPGQNGPAILQGCVLRWRCEKGAGLERE